MAQMGMPVYPKAALIISLVGGIVILLGGILFMFASAFILPLLDYSNVNAPPRLASASIPAIVSGVVGVMGAVGLVSGVIVLVSAVILMTNPGQRRNWGVLILVFSVISFLGLGGFVVGAILGIIGGILALRWSPPTQ
jgi:hypothetical protein